MRAGRGKLPVLAEISAPEPARVWSLRRAEIATMRPPLEQLSEQRVVLAAGDEALPGAVAIAAGAAAMGRRVALLECDLARPRLAARLGLAAKPGLHEYLRWEAEAGEILQPLTLAGPAARGLVEPLICIAGGEQASHPATLLDSESFRHAVAKMRGAYDLIVLVGPPFGPDRSPLAAAAKVADVLVACVPPDQASPRGSRPIRAAIRRLPVSARGAIVVGEA